MTVVAQWAKAPGIHCYVVGSIPAVTLRYCTKKQRKMLFGAQKKEKKKHSLQLPRGEGLNFGDYLAMPTNLDDPYGNVYKALRTIWLILGRLRTSVGHRPHKLEIIWTMAIGHH